MLVVDDSATNRRILAEMLGEWQIQVESAVDAEEAVERVRRAAARGEAFEVVLLDLVMPDHNGLELAGSSPSTTDGPWPTMLLLSSRGGVQDQQLDRRRGRAEPDQAGGPLGPLRRARRGPRGRSTAWRRSREARPPDAGLRLGRRILVVEDNAINQMVAQGVLDALGYESEVAADGVEAVAMAAATAYDAIVMDVQMPQMDGYTATRAHPRRRDRGRPGADHRHDGRGGGRRGRSAASTTGMDAYLTKPLQPDLLEETLRLHLQGHARDLLDERAGAAGGGGGDPRPLAAGVAAPDGAGGAAAGGAHHRLVRGRRAGLPGRGAAGRRRRRPGRARAGGAQAPGERRQPGRRPGSAPCASRWSSAAGRGAPRTAAAR